MTDPLAELSNRGVSIWLDDLSRGAFDTSWREPGDQPATALRRPPGRPARKESGE
jgi:hypothetical protein